MNDLRDILDQINHGFQNIDILASYDCKSIKRNIYSIIIKLFKIIHYKKLARKLDLEDKRVFDGLLELFKYTYFI